MSIDTLGLVARFIERSLVHYLNSCSSHHTHYNKRRKSII